MSILVWWLSLGLMHGALCSTTCTILVVGPHARVTHFKRSICNSNIVLPHVVVSKVSPSPPLQALPLSTLNPASSISLSPILAYPTDPLHKWSSISQHHSYSFLHTLLQIHCPLLSSCLKTIYAHHTITTPPLYNPLPSLSHPCRNSHAHFHLVLTHSSLNNSFPLHVFSTAVLHSCLWLMRHFIDTSSELTLTTPGYLRTSTLTTFNQRVWEPWASGRHLDTTKDKRQ